MDPRDFRTAIDAAERAAAASDFASAERLLKEAARLQEEALGPVHPDLANTLNNLGIVCENTGKPDEAEAFYRRASEMAAATLPPDHPFVATSRRNLADFIRARTLLQPGASAPEFEQAIELGIEAFPEAGAKSTPPADEPAPATSSTPTPPPAPTGTPARPTAPRQQAAKPAAKPGKTVPRTPHAPATPIVTPSTRDRLPATPPPAGERPRWLIPALTAAAILAVVLVATRPWASTESTMGATGAPDPAPVASPAQPPVEPTTPTPAAGETPPAAEPPAASAARDAEAETPPRAPAKAPTDPSGATTLAVAEVCQAFSTGSSAWRCDPVEKEASPGRLAFYTRVRSSRPTTIVHRWYEGDRLRQTVTLNVAANSGAGYRTYSRQTVDAGGEWRVEARSSDGAVLHEARFVVR